MPGLVPGIHVFPWPLEKKDVHGRTSLAIAIIQVSSSAKADDPVL
jgi:hypothetical protein